MNIKKKVEKILACCLLLVSGAGFAIRSFSEGWLLVAGCWVLGVSIGVSLGFSV